MILLFCHLLRFLFSDKFLEEILQDLRIENCELIDEKFLLNNFIKFSGLYSIKSLEIQLVKPYKNNSELLVNSHTIDSENIPLFYRYILYKKVIKIKKELFLLEAKRLNSNQNHDNVTKKFVYQDDSSFYTE